MTIWLEGCNYQAGRAEKRFIDALKDNIKKKYR